MIQVQLQLLSEQCWFHKLFIHVALKHLSILNVCVLELIPVKTITFAPPWNSMVDKYHRIPRETECSVQPSVPFHKVPHGDIQNTFKERTSSSTSGSRWNGVIEGKDSPYQFNTYNDYSNSHKCQRTHITRAINANFTFMNPNAELNSDR